MSLLKAPKPASASTQPQDQPQTAQFPSTNRIPRLPKTLVEAAKLHLRLMYERHSVVQTPAISTDSFPLFLRSALACLLYIITFRKTAWYRLSGELLQQRAEAALPWLKAAVLEDARSGDFSARFMKRHCVGEWNLGESASFDEQWGLFYSKASDWDETSFTQAAAFCAGALYIAFTYRSGASLVRVSYSVVTSFNYAVISLAYWRKFALLDRGHQGFEWVNALSPKPNVGVWWEMELMAIPFVWLVSMHVTFYLAAVSIPVEGEPIRPKSESPVWFVLAGLLFVFGISHAAYVFLTAGRDFEVFEKSWQRRKDGWIFEQQYAIQAPALPGTDQGLGVIEAM